MPVIPVMTHWMMMVFKLADSDTSSGFQVQVLFWRPGDPGPRRGCPWAPPSPSPPPSILFAYAWQHVAYLAGYQQKRKGEGGGRGEEGEGGGKVGEGKRKDGEGNEKVEKAVVWHANIVSTS